MKREIAAAWLLLAGCIPEPGLAATATTDRLSRPPLVLVQDKPEVNLAILDGRLEAAALTVALIRMYNAVLSVAEQNLKLMALVRKMIPSDSDAAMQEQTKNAMLLRQAEIRGDMDTALESYLRLIGEIENKFSLDDITARAAAVERGIGFRGQASIKTALPMMLLHIRLINALAAPSREAVLKDISALSNR